MAPGSRLQELTAKYMQNPRRYFVPLANEYRKANELDRAIALCREHLPAQPGHMSGHIVLGRAYFEKGDIEAAREVFLTSVALDDENLIALRHLGDIARNRNELAEASQWYTRVLEADPQNEEIERIVRSLGATAATETTAPAPEQIAPPAAAAIIDPISVVRAPPTAEDSGLFDPTPPGLRAITSAGLGGAPKVPPMALPPVPSRTLNTFDLSTLDAPLTDSPSPAGGIAVDDGVGFIFDDASALGDPASDAAAGGLTLPPIEEADFSAGVLTPAQAADPVPAAEQDPLVARPALGALASFASWRTAQERDTPTAQAAQTPAATQPPVPPPGEPAIADEPDLFFEASAADAASTAPEFVTETMAALYRQQGFLQQALDVYRELATRSPWDTSLQQKITEIEAVLSNGNVDRALEDDADKALQFGDLDNQASHGDESTSMLEAMYEVSPPESVDAGLEVSFGRPWTPSVDRTAAADDDWFASDDGMAPSADSSTGGESIFGISTDAFGQPAISSADREPVSASSHSSHGAQTLQLVFGSPSATAADESAAVMLIALADQMVGRLPKEAPTLPVPDILELPSSLPGDESTGASPAPLLSFDRFFSGSGSPPRQRIDTPATRSGSTPAWPVAPPPQAPPSLSPTFGGVPVIPPPAVAKPASWATFDQFVPPAPPAPAATPAPVAPVPAPQPPAPSSASQSVVPPSLVPPRPVLRRPIVPPAPVGGPAAYPSFSGLPLDEVAPPAPSGTPAATEQPPAATEPPAASAPQTLPPDDPGDGAAASEFHRWLEGLS